jgi:hypothetical protein
MLLVMIIVMVAVANIAIDAVMLTLVTSIVGSLALKVPFPERRSFGVTKLLYVEYSRPVIFSCF